MTKHAERYEHLVNTLSAIRSSGYKLDCSYHAALYLMTSHPDLTAMTEKYLCPSGIDFPELMKKAKFSEDWMRTVADTAYNLFTWNSKCAATPHDLSILPPPYTQLVFNAMMIAGENYKITVQQSSKGNREILLDDAPLRKKEAFAQMLGGNDQPIGSDRDYIKVADLLADDQKKTGSDRRESRAAYMEP